MTPEEAKIVLQRLVGFWPTPDLAEAEVLVWTDELTNLHLEITVAEALTELTTMSRAGNPFRPRVGQLVAAVRAGRRKTVPALQSGLLQLDAAAETAPPEIRAEYLASMRATLTEAPKVLADARAKRRPQRSMDPCSVPASAPLDGCLADKPPAP